MTDQVAASISEVLDRTRRIETRLTRFMEAQGFDTQVRRPTWNNGVIKVPSPETSLKDCMAVIPKNWNRDDPIAVMHKDSKVAEWYKP
jgi:hypothetical protein